MAIDFLCPNGHALSAADDKAGRTARCPKCAAPFRIPERNGPAQRASSTSDSQIRAGGVAEVRLAESVAAATATEGRKPPAAPAEGTIVFLCPNGHKLNGPARLQGQAGKCPHCGAKFRIPGPEDSQSVELSADDDQSMSAIGESPADRRDTRDAGFSGRRLLGPQEFNFSAVRPGGSSRSWPAVMAELWSHRPPGGSVELHLADGKSVKPHWYAAELSGPEYGMFAQRDAEGSYTMIAIAWSCVARLEVHGVMDLPDEMAG